MALAVNVVIDDERRLCFASFGGIQESLGAAVAFAQRHMRVRVPRAFPVVLSTGAGYPLDATYYQTVKGICAGASILEPGGDPQERQVSAARLVVADRDSRRPRGSPPGAA